MKRNYLIDLLRTILTIFVLAYHLGLCDAGFLAVCGFFTISGYLFAKSIDNQNFKLKDYYLKRLKSLYLPLIAVTFTTVFVFGYIIDLPWVTIKQETLSVLLGYNNIFQIKANSNYFIRSDASPFTHMWYIAILLQLEFFVPLIVFGLKKINYKFNKNHIFSLTIISIILFILIDNKYTISVSYYSMLSRIFSFLIGLSAYHINYFESNIKKIYLMLCLIIALFLCGKYANSYYVILMIATSVLCGIYLILASDLTSRRSKVIDYICEISYLVYLIQYPVIYTIDNLLDCDATAKIMIEFILIVALACFYNSALRKKENHINKISLVIVLIVTFLGAHEFITCPDYYKEMEDLKVQLEVNQELLTTKQEEYLFKIKEAQTQAINNLAEIDEAINNIDETTKNAPILLIGDSIMLGGSFNLDKYFDNYYCDAVGSRNGFLAYETLSNLLDMGVVKDYIVIHLGTNSGLELEEVESIGNLLENQKVLWLTVTNGWRTSMNPMLEEYCNSHENHYLADWYNYSLGHKEYFIADGLHLSQEGRDVYDQFIFDNLKEIIKKDLNDKKEMLISQYNSDNNNIVSFYGNDLLINLYKELDDDYLYYANSNYDFTSLYELLSANKEDLCLSKTIFILLDKSVELSDEELKQLRQLLSDNDVYIFAYNSDTYDLNNILNDEAFLEDGIHLNEQGNELLMNKIADVLDSINN